MTGNTDILAEMEASTGRRALGIVSLWSLCGLLLYVAIASPPALGWQVFLLVLGFGAAWMAEKMRRATAMRLSLTQEGLFDSSGACLCRVEDVVRVERGMFAFKPSNGFLITLKTSAERAWLPGLWWRLGRRVGVGGMTPGGQGKAMADILAAMASERDAAQGR